MRQDWMIENLNSVFRTDDCSEGLRLLAERYANRISDDEIRSAHLQLFPNHDIREFLQYRKIEFCIAIAICYR